MYISYKWLLSYLPDLDNFEPQTIAVALTDSLAEVEGISYIRNGLKNIVSAEVKSKEPHPSNDKLSVCVVYDGREERTIICGAANVRVGQTVAVCLPGGSVFNPSEEIGKQSIIRIEEKKIGSVASFGMICSAKELGIADDHDSILELEPEIQVGNELVSTLTDIVFEIENKSISHRPDCFCHKGIARELSAILKIDFVDVKHEVSLIPTADMPLDVSVKVTESLCSRFCAITLSDVVVKDSPLWLKSRLTAVGIRSVNNIVDLTNFVMLDKGQPMHAFDYDKLSNNEVTVRTAKKDEQLNALDNATYTLDESMVVITDASNKPKSIAGLIGGLDSEISNETKNIVLEAATWEMYNIRRTSRQLGVRTEASMRFEKGLDPNNALDSLKSALFYVQDLAGGEVASPIIDVYPKPREEHKISLPMPMIKRFIGIDISKDNAIEMLELLGLTHLEEESSSGETELDTEIFEIPTFRNDLKIPQDLLEEIARLYGYDNIKPTLPEKDLKPSPTNKVSKLNSKIRSILTSTGMDEVITYSFVNEKQYKVLNLSANSCLKIKNPISPELSLLRTSLIPGLISKLDYNTSQFDEFALFEIGRIIQKELDEEGIHKQPYKVSGVYYSKDSEEAFSKIKYYVESLLTKLNIPNISFSNEKLQDNSGLIKAMHPGRFCNVYSGTTQIGVLGELNLAAAHRLELDGRSSLFELDHQQLLELSSDFAQYKRISEYQFVDRDLSFWLADSIKFDEILTVINDQKDSLIQRVELLDLFTSEKNAGKKSYTISVRLQSYEKTLTEEEINKSIEQITASLIKKLKAEIR